jgi:hypothetical protein
MYLAIFTSPIGAMMHHKSRKEHVMRRNKLVGILVTLASILTLAASLLFGSSLASAATPGYVHSGNGKQANVTVWLTFYGYNDNSGETENQHGSADIAFPKSDGNPTLHNLATEGKGTYNDPVTFAARNNDHKTFPIGSVIYVPLVHKYFIMEDECGDNDPQGCLKGSHHVDLWLGPQKASNSTALANCEDNSTPDSAVTVIINPSSSLPVDTTKMFNNNKCTIHLY